MDVGPWEVYARPNIAEQSAQNAQVRFHGGVATHRTHASVAFFDQWYLLNVSKRQGSTLCLLSGHMEHTHDKQFPCNPQILDVLISFAG